eukprot:5095169-Alexandrium_andersonii.AAC.1
MASKRFADQVAVGALQLFSVVAQMRTLATFSPLQTPRDELGYLFVDCADSRFVGHHVTGHAEAHVLDIVDVACGERRAPAPPDNFGLLEDRRAVNHAREALQCRPPCLEWVANGHASFFQQNKAAPNSQMAGLGHPGTTST